MEENSRGLAVRARLLLPSAVDQWYQLASCRLSFSFIPPSKIGALLTESSENKIKFSSKHRMTHTAPAESWYSTDNG